MSQALSEFNRRKLLVIQSFTFLTHSVNLDNLEVSSGACTMMVAEQTQGYRISFELTKPNQSNPALLVP